MAGASSSSGNFARLLKSSKVISQYDAQIPSLVYTSHGGSFKRSDFGLKRALPKLRSPAIRVAHLDSPQTKLTDFEYGSRELQFVRRAREANVAVGHADPYVTTHEGSLKGVAERPGASTWDTETFEDVEELKMVAKTGKRKAQREHEARRRQEVLDLVRKSIQEVDAQESTEAQRQEGAGDAKPDAPAAFPPDFLAMEEETFQRFLSKLRALQPDFMQFMEEQHTRAQRDRTERHRPRQQGNSVQAEPYEASSTLQSMRRLHPEAISLFSVFDDGVKAAGQRGDTMQVSRRVGQLIDAFLAEHAGEKEHDPTLRTLKHRPHHSLGLAYVPPNLYRSDVSSRPFEARVLSNTTIRRDARGGDSSCRPTSALGTVAAVPSGEYRGPTARYTPDTEGQMNVDFGKTITLIESVQVAGQYDPATGRLTKKNHQEKRDTADSFANHVIPDRRESGHTILDDDPLQISLYIDDTLKAVRFRQTNRDSRIGGQAWVATNTKKPDYRPVSERSTGELFYGGDNQYRDGAYKVTPPNPGRYSGQSEGAKRGKRDAEGQSEVQDLLGQYTAASSLCANRKADQHQSFSARPQQPGSPRWTSLPDRLPNVPRCRN